MNFCCSGRKLADTVLLRGFPQFSVGYLELLLSFLFSLTSETKATQKSLELFRYPLTSWPVAQKYKI